MTLQRTLLIAVLLLFAPTTFANHILRGRVISAQDKTPIPFATLFVTGTTLGCATNLEGEFELKLPSNDRITLRTSMVGYETLYQEVTEQPEYLTLALQSTAINLAEVTVTARSQAAQLQERGYTLNNISAEIAANQSFSTEELLNRSSGVKIRQGGGIGSEAEYNINGLSGGSVKVYVDGVPISSYGGSFSIANIPASTIERIEVYKGVVPAHLADDALGGAINVVTKQGGAQSLSASYAYGSYNTHNFDLNGLYRNERTGLFAGGSLHYNHSDNNYKVWGDAVYTTNPQTGRVEPIVAERFHDQYSSYGAKLTAGVVGRSWADELRFNLFVNDIAKEIQTGATMESVYGNRHSLQQSYMGGVNYRKRDLLPRLDITTSLTYAQAYRTLVDTCNVKYNWSGAPATNIHGDEVHWATTGEGGRATLAKNMENSLNNRTSLRYAIDPSRRHTLSLNGSYFHFTRDVDDPLLSTLEQLLTDTRVIEKYTLSASYEAKLWEERLNLSLFYKYFNQQLSLTDPTSENNVIVPQEVDAAMGGSGYGATLSYRLTPWLRLNTSAEHALRLPTITEMIGNTSENIEPNYNLRPEQSLNFNLGASLEGLAVGRGKLDGNLNLFYRDVRNMIQRAEVNQGDETYGFENLGKVLSRGVDLELRYSYRKRLALSGAVSYTDARFNLPFDHNGAPYLWYGDRLRNMPYFTSNGGATYHFGSVLKGGDRLTLGYHLNYVHAFFKNWESLGASGKAIIPSQLSHDASLLYQLPNKRISIGVDAKNLLNAQLFDNYALQKMGRMVMAKINYKFI